MALLDTVVPATVAGASSVGVVWALLGSIKLPLAKRFDLTEARVATLLSALTMALIPMMLVSGVLSDLVGVRGVLLLGSLVTAGALFTLGVSQTYGTMLTALVLAGAGGALLSAGSIVLMPRAFYPGQLGA